MSEERTTYNVGGSRPLPEATKYRYDDQRYKPPNIDDIRIALKIGGLTGSEAGRLLGVHSRTIRKWTGGEQTIPYSAWRLLLIEIGEIIPDEYQIYSYVAEKPAKR